MRQSDKCFCQYQFWCKNVNFFTKKNWNFGRNVDFFIKCALLLKVIIFLQNMLSFSVKFCLKTVNFIRYVKVVYVLIFIKVFQVSENCYFDSKLSISSAIFWTSVIFLVKSTLHLVYILGRNWAMFWERCFQLSILGKMTIGFRSILVVNSVKNMTICSSKC